MNRVPIGEARKTLNAIVRDQEPTIIRVGNFDRAVVLPLPDEAASVEYEVAVVGRDYIPEPDDVTWTMRPAK